VARFANGKIPANIDLSGLAGWRPRRPRNVLTAAFRFDLPAIISDLRAGDIRTDYPESPTFLVFRQQGTTLDVTAVNAFGRDLLDLCDGDLDPANIATRLRPRHGAGIDDDAFRSSCQEALRQLAALGLVSAAPPHPPSEGR